MYIMRTRLFALIAIVFALSACAKHTQTTDKTVEQEAVSDSAVVVEVSQPIVEEPAKHEAEERTPQKTASHPKRQATTSHVSGHHSASYSSDDEKDDWWEEDTQQSPNDNYLLGFDDDVDDTHDMELYMEDY